MQTFDLGLSGSLVELDSDEFEDVPPWHFHDSAAALVAGGEVLAAIEEERLNRIKHTNAFPTMSIRECIRTAGVDPNGLRMVAFFFGEDYVDRELATFRMQRGLRMEGTARGRLAALVSKTLDLPVAEAQVTFVRHHIAHASATFAASHFRTALVIVADGNGDDEGTTVLRASQDGFEPLAVFPISSSLGHYYTRACEFLGFGAFEEYKVMGLAPYGDRRSAQRALDDTYELLPAGSYRLEWWTLQQILLGKGLVPRRRGAPLTAVHADLAAGVQHVLQEVLLHLVRHWISETGLTDLCLTGGVAHNCTANGLIVAHGVASRVFVHPASHDAGSAVGAALAVAPPEERTRRVLVHANWGPLPGTRAAIELSLERWSSFVESRERTDLFEWAASAIAAGSVIGWVVGRAEFGPRALGNRSILADPRADMIRERLNDMVKKRESFRPFAPVVLAEEAAAYFDLPDSAGSAGFMSFAVPVRPDVRALLPAVTHVDGSARVQVVTREANERLWTLLRAFHDRTRCPVLLNTSLNNFAEPMVVTVEDALRTLLTTGLDALVVDDWVVSRRTDISVAVWLGLSPSLPRGTVLQQRLDGGGRWRLSVKRRQGQAAAEISVELARQIAGHDGLLTGLAQAGTATGDDLAAERRRLWELRLIELAPPID